MEKVWKKILSYVLAVVMIVGMLPSATVKAEGETDPVDDPVVNSYKTGLYFAQWDNQNKTLNDLNRCWYTEIPDEVGIALLYADEGAATYQSVDVDNVAITYAAVISDNSAEIEASAFSEPEEGQIEEVQLSEQEYNSWAVKEIDGGTFISETKIPVSYYRFYKTGTYRFTYSLGENEYSCYLTVEHKAWDFYAEDEISDNPLRDYYYRDITEDTAFYLKQADGNVSLGKLTYAEDGAVCVDESGNPVLDTETGAVVAARFEWDNDTQQEKVVNYNDCISYYNKTGKISIVKNPEDNTTDYVVRVYYYNKNERLVGEDLVTDYWQGSADVWVHHGEDMSSAIWVGFDENSGSVAWQLTGVEGSQRTELSPGQGVVGNSWDVYDFFLTEKENYPDGFDWDKATEEERNRYGWREGAKPVVYVHTTDEEEYAYRVDSEDETLIIDDCDDTDTKTWHFCYTYQAGDWIDIFWCDYDAFMYDDSTQFQIEMGSQNADAGGVISLSPTPGENDSFQDAAYGEKYNFAVSQIQIAEGVSVTFTPNSGNTLEEVRIGDTRYVNAALQTGSENSDPTFTPEEDGSWTYTFKADDVKAYHWENNGTEKVYETDENGNPRYANIYVEARFQGQGEEPWGPSMSDDFTVTIGSDVVYDASREEGKKITVSENALYDVEETEWGDGIAIKPKRGINQNPDSEENTDEMTGITLAPIVATGSGRVEVHAGLNYTPEKVPEDAPDGFHIEEDVPITILASESGYSFEATDDVDFVICGGNFRSTATLRGGIMARGFSVNDVKELTIGSEDAPVAQAFCAPLRDSGGQQVVYESSAVEFNLAKVNIYAKQAFTNYKELRAWDEADVTVAISGNDAKMFENVDSMQVQTGGKFTLQSDAAIDIPDDFEVKAGYYTEIGEILTIPDDGRFQDYVNMVSCEIGDHADTKGRYNYFVSEDKKTVTLESTTHTLWSLGYSFLPDSGDQYVENGHFEISAGSGLCRADMTDGGEYWFEAGTEVLFKLVPDTGYQYKEGTFRFNGDNSERVVKPTENPGEYIFTMPSNPIHVACTFEKADDAVTVASKAGVSGANISIPDGVISGTAEFIVEDTTLTAAQSTAFAAAAQGMTVGNAMDLSLNEVINQIGTNDKWVTPVTDLAQPMSVTLKLDASLAGQADYEVIREHNGKTEALTTKYDEKTGSITFATDGYSTYAIAYKQKEVSKPHVHTTTKVAAKAATCTTPGYTEYYTCSCRKWFKDAAATKEIIDKSSVVVYATGHKWDDGKVTKEATASEEGAKTFTCSVCGETKTESIPATGIPEKGEKVQDDKGTASFVVTGTDEKNLAVAYAGATNKKAKTIKVPSTVKVNGVTYQVTAIANNAFKNNKTVTKVTIPKSVTTIGKNAFSGCTKIKTISIGSKVTTIGANAFKGCKSLTKITLPDKTTKIGANAFNGCKNLKMITIKSKKLTLKSVSKNAFKGISSKVTIKVPKGKTKAYKTLLRKRGLSKKVTVK